MPNAAPGSIEPVAPAVRKVETVSEQQDTSKEPHQKAPPEFSGSPPSALSLQEALGVVVRRRAWIATVFLVVLAFVATVTAFQTPQYVASSKVLVKFGREFLYSPDSGDRPTLVGRNRESLLNSVLEILRSRSVVAAVVEDLGAQTIYPKLTADNADHLRQLAEERLRESFSAAALPDTELIRLHFSHADPEMSARVANALVDAFLDKHLEAFGEPRRAQFLDDKADQYRAELEAADDAVRDFEGRHPSLYVDDPGAALQRQRAEIESSLRETESQIAETRAELAAESPTLTRTRRELLDLQLSERELLASYREGSRPVTSVRGKIGLVEDFLTTQEAELAKRTEQSLKPLEVRTWRLRRKLEDIDATLTQLPVLTRDYRELVRSREVKEELYRAQLHKLEASRVSQEMDEEQIANISIIEKAHPPSKPYTPRVALNLLLGGMVGLGLGLLSAFVAERLFLGGRRRVGTSEADSADEEPWWLRAPQ